MNSHCHGHLQYLVVVVSHQPCIKLKLEQDYLDTLSGEVFEAEVYSSQMLEMEDVGHLYNIFTWAQRLLKVASFQEIITIFPPPIIKNILSSPYCHFHAISWRTRFCCCKEVGMS